jgi:arabinofuranosyltransferase
MVAVSGALIAATVTITRPRSPLSRLVFASPFALPLAHVLWRKGFYGEWLPNTYYAKHVSAWPEAGVRYLLSYLLEYGLWLWAILALLVLVSWGRRRAPGFELREALRAPTLLVPLSITLTVLVHLGYYSFVIGGDHFEYRVYSHSVPLVLVTTIWMVNYLVEHGSFKRSWGVVVPFLVVTLALPIPWAHWAKAREFTTRRETLNMTIPLAPSFPPGTRWYVHWFDELQQWLIRGHAIGKRHREHQVFVEFQLALFPRERLMEDEWYDEHRVLPYGAVGVPGWILARAHLIDTKGLSDYVIARYPVPETQSRRMAHDRLSPRGYLDCFKPNLAFTSPGLLDLDTEALATFESPGFTVLPRKSALTAEEIEGCELRWRRWISDRR